MRIFETERCIYSILITILITAINKSKYSVNSKRDSMFVYNLRLVSKGREREMLRIENQLKVTKVERDRDRGEGERVKG